MAHPTEQALRAALARLKDPVTGQDLISAGRLDSLDIRGGLVQAALRTTREEAPRMEALRHEAQAVLAREPGVTNATVVLTAHSAQAAHEAPAHGAHGGHGGQAGGHGAQRATLLGETRAIVAVASGKGGVGKSTVAVNLAVSLARRGLEVGLLDADIYGPSLPRMLGITGKPEMVGDKLLPIEVWGLKAMSIGLLVDEETPMIWRGPMVMGALEQLMGQVAWGPLDVMIVDMPPGTGDAQLTMAQRVKLAGAVIVSTPQDVALLDARRGVRMFERTKVPVLGIIENMSYFCCPNCGHRTEIFGHGGAKAEAARLGVEFLGEVPLLAEVRTLSDAGTPVAAHAPESEAAHAYAAIAEKLLQHLGGAPAGPRIVIE